MHYCAPQATGGSANDPSMDGKPAFHFGMTYVKEGETEQRVHLLMPALGVDLPYAFSSRPTPVQRHHTRAPGDSMAQERASMHNPLPVPQEPRGRAAPAARRPGYRQSSPECATVHAQWGVLAYTQICI